MTDRLRGFTVVLDEPLREDDAQAVADAIMQLRGVNEVRPVVADVLSDGLAVMRERTRIEGRVREMFRELREERSS